ncbi:MAG: hypothetical protein J6Y02_04535 [Pseudobutyrivibrio sp.]|nr:hypothetical protein [Pseudobutyrivibrio sp.]
MVAKKNTITKKVTTKKPEIKKTLKKDSNPNIREAHEFIAGLVRYPFKKLAKSCDAPRLLMAVGRIIKDIYVNKEHSDIINYGYVLDSKGSNYTRATLQFNIRVNKDMDILDKVLWSLVPLNKFRGPVSKSSVAYVTGLDGCADAHFEISTTCSLGNTFLDDNYDRMFLKATLTLIYNFMYANTPYSDKIALYAYQYLQKYIITDEKKELAR